MKSNPKKQVETIRVSISLGNTEAIRRIIGNFMASQVREKAEDTSFTSCIGTGKSYDKLTNTQL